MRQLAVGTSIVFALLLAGCTSSPRQDEPNQAMGLLPPKEAAPGKFGPPFPGVKRGYLRPSAAVLTVDDVIELNSRIEKFDIYDATNILVGTWRFGPIDMEEPSLNRPFSGVLRNSATNNIELEMSRGWSYSELNGLPGGGIFRPTIRTRRVVASSNGTSALIFIDDDGTGDLGTGEEFIVNLGGSGGDIEVRNSAGALLETIEPGNYVKVTGTSNVSAPKPLPGGAPAPGEPGHDPETYKIFNLLGFAQQAIVQTN